MNQKPYEILAMPFTLYLAPTGTVFPPIDETPGAGWTKVGTSGDLNYGEDGITITHNESVEVWRALGSTGPRKAFRTEEELHISLMLADLSLEQYAMAVNYNTVATVAAAVGEAGYKKMGLSRGLDVPQRALLVRGPGASPYGGQWNLQYEFPVAVQVGEPEVVFVKGEPAMLQLEWQLLEDLVAATEVERFGRVVAQNTDPGT